MSVAPNAPIQPERICARFREDLCVRRLNLEWQIQDLVMVMVTVTVMTKVTDGDGDVMPNEYIHT